MTTFTGYIARETEKAYGVLPSLTDEKLAWIPKKKIENETRSELAAVIVLAGETIQRKVWLTDLEIDTEWFNKVLA
jgi:hypothetical protein